MLHVAYTLSCANLFNISDLRPNRSKWHGPVSWQAHLWSAEPPPGVPGPVPGHGEHQHGTIPTSEPQAGTAGTVCFAKPPDWLLQAYLCVGRHNVRHSLRALCYPSGLPLHSFRAQLYLLVLAGVVFGTSSLVNLQLSAITWYMLKSNIIFFVQASPSGPVPFLSIFIASSVIYAFQAYSWPLNSSNDYWGRRWHWKDVGLVNWATNSY